MSDTSESINDAASDGRNSRPVNRIPLPGDGNHRLRRRVEKIRRQVEAGAPDTPEAAAAVYLMAIAYRHHCRAERRLTAKDLTAEQEAVFQDRSWGRAKEFLRLLQLARGNATDAEDVPPTAVEFVVEGAECPPGGVVLPSPAHAASENRPDGRLGLFDPATGQPSGPAVNGQVGGEMG